jgi:hypothetical protein
VTDASVGLASQLQGRYLRYSRYKPCESGAAASEGTRIGFLEARLVFKLWLGLCLCSVLVFAAEVIYSFVEAK